MKIVELFFTQDVDGLFRFNTLAIFIASWATKQQDSYVWKLATIAYLEGWKLEPRTERTKNYKDPTGLDSLYFIYRDDSSKVIVDKTFKPSEQAKFDISLLERK
jgi:hypothetical protein